VTTAKWTKTKHPRVFVWHEKECPAYDDKRCRCDPKYRGEVWNPATKKPDKSRRFSKVDEAIGWVADARRGLDSPTPSHVSGVPVLEFLATFIEAARVGTARAKGEKRYAKRTLDKYEKNVGHHVAPHVKTKTTGTMDATAWQIVVDKIVTTGQRDVDGNPTGEPLGDGTVAAIFAAVRAAYRWGAAPSRRVVSSNPLRDVQLPKGGKSKRKRVAPPETIPALLEALHGRRDLRGPNPNPAMRIAWAFMFYAGLRISEVVALDWTDISGGYVTVGETKSEAGTNRRIPMAAPLAAIVADWKKERGGFPIGPVLPGVRTLRASTSGITHAAERWADAGFPIYAPHEARHTFASTVIANRDVSLADLQEWLGHASLETTAIYVKTLPGWRQESAHERISGAFG
jgi:integrase